MEITMDLNKEMFKKLFHFFLIGEWVINSENTKKSKIDDNLLNLMMKIVKEKSIYKNIEYDDDLDCYFFMDETEDRLLEPLEKYAFVSGMEQFVDFLIRRDLEEKFGEPVLNKMPTDQKDEEYDKLEDYYSQEVGKNGFRNFRLVKK